MESSSSKPQAKPLNKQPVPREGNKALEIERPLFEKGQKLEFKDLKKHYLERMAEGDQEQLNQLAGLSYLNDVNVESDQDTVILSSYPRSGNTLLRAYLEKIMGLVTGSDCDIEKKLNKELMYMGLHGEGLVDKRVWVVKTHYPERYGKTKFYAERCILCVRNPIDAITSLFNMVCTGSHNKSIANGDYPKFDQQWTEFIEQEITVWKDFHEFWLNAKIPVHIIKFEDILANPKITMTNLLKFILNTSDIQGTKIEKYIDLAVKEKAPEIYKPREGKSNANLDKFNKEHLDFMFEYAKDLITNMGYDDTFTGVTSPAKSPFIDNFNNENLKKSMFIANESDDITSIFINYPALLLRKKSMLYPEGRTSYRFKRALRKKVTIIDKHKSDAQAADER